MKFKIIDMREIPYHQTFGVPYSGGNGLPNETVYSAHIIINRQGKIDKNSTKWSNEELHDITDGFFNLDKINEIGRRRLLI